MNGLNIFYSFLSLIAGVGVFLLGIKMMGDNLESLFGNRIKKMFEKLDKNVFVGIGIGISTTAIIQSSGAVTAMAIGFVNSGFMSLMQATSIIFGANIGTTVTAQIIALGYGATGQINIMLILASLAGFGSILMFAKKDRVRLLGLVITGLGILFVGLNLMSLSMEGFTESAAFQNFISTIKNPVLLILTGIVATAVLQSSSAFSGIVIAMSASGLLDFSQAMFLVVGSNLGSCISALIASIGTEFNAKRVAFLHVTFNFIGVLLFVLTNLFLHYDKLFLKMDVSMQYKVALLHTLFNIATALILLPFIKLLVRLSEKVIPEKKNLKAKDGKHFYFVNDLLLKTPLMAIEQLKLEIMHMLKLAMDNFEIAINAIISMDTSKKAELAKREDIIDYLNKSLVAYMVKISQTSISEKNRIFLGTAHHTVADAERIGDYADNIMEYAVEAEKEGIIFSDTGLDETLRLKEEIFALYAAVVQIYEKKELHLIPEAYAHENEIDQLKILMGENHLIRLADGSCSPGAGAYYLSLANDCERIGDHLINIVDAAQLFYNGKRAKNLHPKQSTKRSIKA